MGNGPGQIKEYEDLVDTYPRLHGGFVWEWRDHGLLARTPSGEDYHAYGGDFGEVVHDGNFVMDGLVLPDDTPTPGLGSSRPWSHRSGSRSASGRCSSRTGTTRPRPRDTGSAGHCRGTGSSRPRAASPPGVVAARESATLPVPDEVLAAASAELAAGDELWFA